MMSEISETNKALVDRDSEMKMLGDRCEAMQAAMNEHTSKADSMESDMFHHFTEILVFFLPSGNICLIRK